MSEPLSQSTSAHRGPHRRAVLLGALAALLPVAARAESCCGAIAAEGKALARFLDGTHVNALWDAHWHVNWMTGEHDKPAPGGPEAATHCSAFVAAVAYRLGVYVLRPPEHPQELLANAQLVWLREQGAAQGWEPVSDPQAAQEAANQGRLVLACFESPNPHRPGHIAIVRPSTKSAQQLSQEGPQIIQAGTVNYVSTSLARGFREHRGAWSPGGGAVRFYAHAVDPRRLASPVA